MADAEAYYRHCVIDNADWAAVDRIMAMRGDTRETLAATISRNAACIRPTAWAAFRSPAILTPSRATWPTSPLPGARGIALSFVNYADELPYFCDEVLPRLQRLGLRI